MHDVKVELPRPSYIEGESSDFAADLTSVGFVTIIFGSSGSELVDEVAAVYSLVMSPWPSYM